MVERLWAAPFVQRVYEAVIEMNFAGYLCDQIAFAIHRAGRSANAPRLAKGDSLNDLLRR